MLVMLLPVGGWYMLVTAVGMSQGGMAMDTQVTVIQGHMFSVRAVLAGILTVHKYILKYI